MHKRLGEILLDFGVINEEQLRRSLELQHTTGNRLGDILVELGAANAAQITKALNYQKQVFTGVAIAAGLGLGLAPPIPQFAFAGGSVPQSSSQCITASVPQVLEVDYTGNPILAFTVDENDIRAGYTVVTNHGDVLWRTNAQRWEVRVEHGEWNSPKPLQLYVKHGEGDDPSDRAWTYLDEGPTSWVEGDRPGRGKFEGIDWMVLLPVSGLPPGMYLTTVMFTIVSTG